MRSAADSLSFLSDYTSDGVVISKVHLHSTALNWKDASLACAARGMRLFQMTSPETAQVLFAVATVKYGFKTGSVLWVDGLLPDVCQSVQNMYGPFVADDANCSTKMFSFCEEVKVERSLSNSNDLFTQVQR
jgi:hypothetical protein